ncbi:MAG: hypothetical protein ACYC5J_12550 [Chloroflexota bacterium]
MGAELGAMRFCHGIRLSAAIAVFSLLALLSPAAMPPQAVAAPLPADGWTTDPTYTLVLLGRDGANSSDRYLVTLDWGGSFFAVGAQSMPLMAAEPAVELVMEGYRNAFPGRPMEDIQPGDSWDFHVPAGTFVTAEWRKTASSIEYRSLRGDSLVVYTNPRAPLVHLLVRAESPRKAEVTINLLADLTPQSLAETLYGQGDPNFTPDFLQLTRAKGLIESGAETATIDLSRTHLDDLRELRGTGQAGGKTEDGMDIYWFHSGEQAQPLFRIDDSIGDRTDPTGLPSLIRVYYYKTGTVRTYQRASDALFLSGRQPRGELWEKVYQEWGQLDPAPTRWEIGQPEQDDQAAELNKMDIVVLRFQPKDPPKGNFFTNLLDMLMAMMKRKQT